MDSHFSPDHQKSFCRDDQVVLSILEEIEKNPKTSQRTLAGRLGIAVGLVNSLVKRVVSKGYVKIKRINSRNIQYLLTPSGVYEKSRLTYRFIRHSFRYLSMYRQKTFDVLSPFAEKGLKNIAIFGSGEEAELSFLAIRELKMRLIAIVDPLKFGMQCIGYDIQNVDWLLKQNQLDLLLVLHSCRYDGEFDLYCEEILSNSSVKHILHVEI